MRRIWILIFGLLIPFFPITNAVSTAFCLSNLPDTAWTNGQATSGAPTSNEIILTHASVVPESGQNLGGLAAPTGAVIPSDAQILAAYDYTDGLQRAWPLSVVDSFLTKSWLDPVTGHLYPVVFYDITSNPQPRSIKVMVSFIYEGSACTKRTISIPASIEVRAPTTHFLNSESDPNQVIEDFVLRRFPDENFITRNQEVARLRGILDFWKSTETHPLPALPQKGGDYLDLWKAMNAHPESSFNNLYSLWESSDGCISDVAGDKFINLMLARGIYKSSRSGACAINIHFAPYGIYSEHLVIQGWLSSLPSSATTKATITCIKGKLTKTVTAVKPACPTGYKRK